MTQWLLYIRKKSACAFYKKLKMIDFGFFTSMIPKIHTQNDGCQLSKKKAL